MKKAIVGLLAFGALVGLRPLGRRLSKAMRRHCARMAAQCKQIADQFAGDAGARGTT